MNRNLKMSLLPATLIGVSIVIAVIISAQNSTAVNDIKTDELSLAAIVVSLAAVLISIIVMFLVESTKYRVLLALLVILGVLIVGMAYVNYGVSQVNKDISANCKNATITI